MKQETECLPEGLCPSCFEGNLHDASCDYAATLPTGREFVIKCLPCSLCDHCGARFYSPETSQQIEAAMLKASGLLSPEQVVRLVELTGLTEDQLCEKLGLGAKTIYRWRKGAQRPSKSLSMLLAIVAYHPTLLQWLERSGWEEERPAFVTGSLRRGRIDSSHNPPRRLATPRLDRIRNTGKMSEVRGRGPEVVETEDRRILPPSRNIICDFFQLAGSNG